MLSDCPLGWGHEPRFGQRILRLGVETRFWPLYEVVPKPAPIEKWLRPQKRFAHLFAGERPELIAEVQRSVDAEWDALLARCA